MRILFQILLLVFMLNGSSVFASHSFGGLDMCALYPEVMPPGLMPEQLPDAGGQGALLMETYCTQCHALPGPGRHTAEQWPQVLDRMFVLMDVTVKFGGLLGNVKTLSTDERDHLSSYLVLHSLKPMTATPQGIGAVAFENHCGGCHALPDPARYNNLDWSNLIKRMQRNMEVMKYSPPSADIMIQIQLYLQKNSNPAEINHLAVGDQLMINEDNNKVSLYDRPFSPGSWMTLTPFFVLIIIGLARWRVNHQHMKRLTNIKQVRD